MSRLTGKEVCSLMEAYQAVYAPQELTEEQVWEGVENWVHSLLEEGYDLSDYTWEEMYEAYLEEQGGRSSAAIRNQNVYTPPASERPQIAGGGMGGMRGSGRDRNSTQTSSSPGALRVPAPTTRTALDPGRFQREKDRLKDVGNPPATIPKVIQRPGAPAPSVRPVVPSTPSNGNGPKVIQRPGAPAPRPATTPDSKMGGDPMDQWTRANPTLAAKVKPGQSGYNTIKTRLDADNDRRENYDAYDLILSHLINEGYADTNESALVIMANMSEEWKYSIVEAQKPLPRRKMENRIYNVNMKTGEAAGSDRNERIRSTLNAYKNDPEGEAAKARAKSKYKG